MKVPSNTLVEPPSFFDGPVLVTCDDWLRAKDGRQYRAVWGAARLVKAEELLGFKPTNSANWGLIIGEGSPDAIFIAGCRIHYIQRCADRPVDIETLMLGGRS